MNGPQKQGYSEGVNTLFRIAFGDYEFVLDRTSLTYSLTETVTKTVWATALSLGWIELKDRETGTITRTDFGDCKLVSIAEKMGAAGKRILLGLDAPGGVPVDIYLICGPKEIQLTVEASRDSKTHLLERVGLLPGLCRAEQGGYLVLPNGQGMILRPEEFTDKSCLSRFLHVWDASLGLSMPFIGVVSAQSALSLITDSAYGGIQLTGGVENPLSADWIYTRDPERRRLDIRISILPKGNYISVARTYRDKLIGERNHITLRKKIRERLALGDAMDAFWAHTSETKKALQNLQIKKIVVFENHHNTSRLETEQRWQEMEKHLEEIKSSAESSEFITSSHNADWLGAVVDVWGGGQKIQKCGYLGRPVPLEAVIYHDSVVSVSAIVWSHRRHHPHWPQAFLRALLTLSPPSANLFLSEKAGAEQFLLKGKEKHYQAIGALLSPLYALTFPAFLTTHQFLTPDFLVEEAFYSDKTYVLINQSETEPYDAGEFLLPPCGFYVRHPQFEAHDALRVGELEFSTRAWRVRRSLDGKPLEQSENIEEKEFEVS